MGSFRLTYPDGREATRAGCLLALVSGLVTFVGLMAGVWIAISSGPLQLPAWIDPAWLNKDSPVLRTLAIAVATGPGVILFWVGSRWLKRRGVEVWRKPDGNSSADNAATRALHRFEYGSLGGVIFGAAADAAEKALLSSGKAQPAPPSIVFACPGCGKKHRVKAGLAGTMVKCAHSGQQVLVPSGARG